MTEVLRQGAARLLIYDDALQEQRADLDLVIGDMFCFMTPYRYVAQRLWQPQGRTAPRKGAAIAAHLLASARERRRRSDGACVWSRAPPGRGCRVPLRSRPGNWGPVAGGITLPVSEPVLPCEWLRALVSSVGNAVSLLDLCPVLVLVGFMPHHRPSNVVPESG